MLTYMAEHNTLGKIGEDIACKLMQKEGFRISQRNWRFGHLEIDIIAENRKEIVFVEVKTRSSTFGGIFPAENVDILKKRRLTKAANAYIHYYKIEKAPRFDIIGLLIDKESYEIKEQTHIKNAFKPHCKTITANSFNGLWRWIHRK